MPYFDGTGPMGWGQATGWRLGPCLGGFGGRRRRTWLGRFFPHLSAEEKKEMLEARKESIKEELEDIELELNKA